MRIEPYASELFFLQAPRFTHSSKHANRRTTIARYDDWERPSIACGGNEPRSPPENLEAAPYIAVKAIHRPDLKFVHSYAEFLELEEQPLFSDTARPSANSVVTDTNMVRREDDRNGMQRRGGHDASSFVVIRCFFMKCPNGLKREGKQVIISVTREMSAPFL
jgi:hypothetical protein